MAIYFSTNIGWLYSILVPVLIWLFILIYRRGYSIKKEFRSQLVVGFIAVIGSYFMELFGISTKLWTYFPEPWSINLWIVNFFVGLALYQIVKLVG